MSMLIPFSIGRYEMRGEPGSAIPKWSREKPLTDEQIEAIFQNTFQKWGHEGSQHLVRRMARAIEAAHGITP